MKFFLGMESGHNVTHADPFETRGQRELRGDP